MSLWEILVEMTIGAADTVAVAEEVLVEAEGRVLAEAEASTGVKAVETDQCLQLPVATVEKSVKCLLGLQTANRFIAVSVLKRKTAVPIHVDLMTEVVLLRHKVESI